MIELLQSPASPKGYKIWQRDVPSWTDSWNRQVGGYTYCAGKEMHIGTSRTVFAHELAHVLQECSAELPIDQGQDVFHADWGRKGIYFLVEEASR